MIMIIIMIIIMIMIIIIMYSLYIKFFVLMLFPKGMIMELKKITFEYFPIIQQHFEVFANVCFYENMVLSLYSSRIMLQVT